MIGQDFSRILRLADTDPLERYELENTTPPEPTVDLEQVAYERGVAAGQQEAEARITALADLQSERNALLAKLVEEIRLNRDLIMKDTEETVSALALEIARKVMHEQADSLREAIVSQAREAVARVRDNGPVKIFVHPEDVAALEAARASLAQAFDGAVVLQVEGDAKVTRGGCLVETPARLVDARVEVQLMRIAEALRRKGVGKQADEGR